MQKHNFILGTTALLVGLILSGCTSLNLILDGTEMPSAQATAVPAEEAAPKEAAPAGAMAEETENGEGAMGVMGEAAASVSTASLRLHRFPDESSPCYGWFGRR